jgi:hypothetical protein
MNALWERFNPEKTEEFINASAQEIVTSIKNTIPAVGIRSRSSTLLNSVKYEMRSSESATIFIDETKAPYAKYLEEGYSPFDMKKGLLSSPKSRISKEGYRYIRIPIDDEIKTLSEKSQNKGMLKYASLWHHPGYNGKLFFKQGVEEVLPNIIRKAHETFFSKGK